MQPELISYQNDPKLKQEIIQRMKLHIKADELVQGETGSNGKGCLVWCALNCYNHKKFSDKLGVDLWVPKMLDRIFEGMLPEKAQLFSLDILTAILVGITKKETDMIRLKILHYILTEIIPKKYQSQKKIQNIILLFENAIKGVTVTSKEWQEVKRAAAAATATADAAATADADAYAADAAAVNAAYAYVAADAAAAYAAYAADAADAAAYAYAYADADAADAAAYAYAYADADAADDAYTYSFEKIGNQLIQLFKENSPKSL